MAYENLDAELVNELLKDGRASLRSVGESLGVSVTTVSNHLRDLETAGTIKGFVPVIDYDTLGYDVTAILQLKVEGEALPEITDRLESMDRMITVYEVTGEFDIIAVGKFEDTDSMDDIIKELLAEKDIKESNTSVVLSSPVECAQFPLPIEEE
ncbi:MAG: HTH-type transcriptional regulator Lrp [Halodesulfurarchaeum sp.]|nr:HTH-type transcriptional regulator Lrp [Halodesulfurarchaeum sp.]